jgi:protein-tyrosine phosphatase
LPIDILIICTANRCRSPIAEAVLRRRLEERGIAATVSSAGLLPPGYPAMDDAVATAAEVGLDLAGHLSRTVTRELVVGADLVIAMERQHVVDLAVLAPDVWPKIFQLRDLVRRAEAAGRPARDRPLGDWLAELGAGRTPATVFAAPLADDIPDPVAGPRSAYDQTRQVLDELLTRLAALLR